MSRANGWLIIAALAIVMAASVAFRLDTVNRLDELGKEQKQAHYWDSVGNHLTCDLELRLDCLIRACEDSTLSTRIDSMVYQFHQDMRWRDAKLNNSWEWIQRHEREKRQEAGSNNP
jgi:hypothetical protein